MFVRTAMKAASTAVLFIGLTATPAFAAIDIFEPPTVADAQRLQQRGEFEQAADAWWQIVEADPDNAEAWFNLGYSLHITGRVEEALAVHQKAAEFDRYRGIALYNLGCAYSLLGESDRALEALEKSAKAGFDVASYAADDSDLDSLRHDPRFNAMVGGGSEGEAWEQHQAQSHGGMNPARMQEMFQFVAQRMQPIIEEIMPQIEERMAMIAETAMMHAQEIMQQIHERVEDDPELHDAIEELHDALSQDPRFAPLMEKVHGFMSQPGDAPHAEQENWQRVHVEEPAAAAPTAPAEPAMIDAFTMNDAQQAQQAGRYAEAAHMFKSLAKAQPDNAMAQFGYAYNLHMSGEHEAAIDAHKAAAKFEQLRGIAMYNLGCAYALTGQADKAIEALRASAEAGFDVAGSAGADSDLESLRDDQRFRALIRDRSNDI